MVGACAKTAHTPPNIQVITATPLPLPNLPTQKPTVSDSGLLSVSNLTPIAPERSPDACEPPSIDSSNVRYNVEAILYWVNRRIEVEQTTYYRNDFDFPLYELVFHVEPNRLESYGVMAMRGVFDANGTLMDSARLESTRLTVPLLSPLLPHCETRLRIVYLLQIPNNGDTVGARFGYLGYTWRQVNLGHWLPTIAHYDLASRTWVTNQKYNIGEQTIPERADYQVMLTVQNAPEGLQVAAPGVVNQIETNQWRFNLSQARDFALSLSTEFGQVNSFVNGVSVEVFYFPATQPPNLNAAEQALKAAQEALVLYSDLFGAYPHERLVIVEGDFPDGMEFTGLVFVSEAWFSRWNGKTESWLTIITVHEVSHQWWYAMIANDQGMNPYLDETLATYSEHLYFEHYYPDSIPWWWELRIAPYETPDTVDASIYEFTTVRPYINAVYLKGVRMMQAIRERIGDEAFMAWLQNYAALNRGGIVYPYNFWSSLSAEAYNATADIRLQFLKETEPMAVSE